MEGVGVLVPQTFKGGLRKLQSVRQNATPHTVIGIERDPVEVEHDADLRALFADVDQATIPLRFAVDGRSARRRGVAGRRANVIHVGA